MTKTIAIVSGGLDSVTLAHWLKAQGHELHLLCFDYGQLHKKELYYAGLCARMLEAKISTISLTSLTGLLKGSALTDSAVAVPDGHYEHDSMRATIVPNRNALMLSIAYAVAAAEGADYVAAGMHAGDHYIYPDCRASFCASFATMEREALEGVAHVDLLTPFIHSSKADIVQTGAALGVPVTLTWSCYKGADMHCGTCGTCVERREAFCIAQVRDPTTYQA